MKKKLLTIVLFALVLVLTTGCVAGNSAEIKIPAVSIEISAPGPNPALNHPDAKGQTAGILLGVWHGVISPVTMALSFSNPVVQMYEVHNDGSEYNLGFLLGVALIFMVLGGFLYSRR